MGLGPGGEGARGLWLYFEDAITIKLSCYMAILLSVKYMKKVGLNVDYVFSIQFNILL